MYIDEASEWTEEDMKLAEKIIKEHPLPENMVTLMTTPKGKNFFATIIHRVKEEESNA